VTDKDTQPKTDQSPAKTEDSEPQNPAAKDKVKARDGSRSQGSKRRHGGKLLGLFRGLFWLVLLGLLLTLAYGGWLLWQQQHAQNSRLQQIEQNLGEQTQALERQQQRLSQATESLAGELERKLQARQRESDQRLQQLEQNLSGLNRRLSRIAGGDREDWKLAEAEYLLRLANQRLVLENDARNALALAETADRILGKLDNPDLIPIRRALATDIQALKLAERPDREGIYLELLALDQQIPKLRLAQNPAAHQAQTKAQASDQADTAGAEPAESGLWGSIKHSFTRLLQNLDGYIRVRRHNQTPEVMPLDARERLYLDRRLQLQLEQARSALMREQPGIYRASLERAADWLERYYALSSQTRELVQRLETLAQIQIAPELPDITAALNQLSHYLEQRHRLSSGFQSAPSEDKNRDEEAQP